jgi:hypothetical protein
MTMLELWNHHGTKILGTAQALVSGWVLIPNLIPSDLVPLAHAINVTLGVLTVQRGITNTRSGQ